MAALQESTDLPWGGSRSRARVQELYLSGGSFRAATASAGAVAYLAATERWGEVDLVSSVSGGSLFNGALLASYSSDLTQNPESHGEPYATITAFLGTLSTKGGVFGTWPRRAAMAEFAVEIVALVSALLATVVFAQTILAVAVGLGFVPLCLGAFRRMFSRLTRNGAEVVVGRDVTSAQRDRPREHRINASGLSTGTPVAIVWPGAASEQRDDGSALRIAGLDREIRTDGLELRDAVFASTALPGAGGVAFDQAGRQWLIDGGASGTFGDTATLNKYWNVPGRNRGQRDLDRPLLVSGRPATKYSLAVDGSRHMEEDGRLARRLGRASYLYLLNRWLKVSIEATYVNDVADRSTTRIVRVCQPFDGAESSFEHRMNDLVAGTARIGLVGFNADRAAVILCNSILSTAVELGDLIPSDGQADVTAREILDHVGGLIGCGPALTLAWDRTARVMFFANQPSRFALSHEGLTYERDISIEGYKRAIDNGFRRLQVDLVVDKRSDLRVAHSVTGRPPRNLSPDAPTLPALMASVDRNDVYWNLEVKSNTTREELVRFLRGQDDLNRFCVSAPLRSGLLRHIREQVPGIATNDSVVEGAGVGRSFSLRGRDAGVGCQLSRHVLGLNWPWLKQAAERHPSLSRLVRWDWPINAANRRGRTVQAYVVNDADQMSSLWERGVSGVITDLPLSDVVAAGLLVNATAKPISAPIAESTSFSGSLKRNTLSDRPRVLVSVVGAGGQVNAILSEDELQVVQEELFGLAPTLVHIGTDSRDLQELLSSDIDFEIVHLIVDVARRPDRNANPNDDNILWMDGASTARDVAGLFADNSSSCRLVLISGESGNFFAEPLARELGLLNVECAVAGVPFRRSGDDERLAYLRGLYRQLVDPASLTASIREIFTAGSDEMGKQAGRTGVGDTLPSGDEPADKRYSDAILFSSTTTLTEACQPNDSQRDADRRAERDVRDLLCGGAERTGLHDAAHVCWRTPTLARSLQMNSSPSLNNGEDFSIVSWVQCDDEDESTSTQWWADTRGCDESSSAPTGTNAQGWAVGISDGYPRVQLNSGSCEHNYHQTSVASGVASGRSDTTFRQHGVALKVNDGRPHCIVFSFRWDGDHRLLSTFVDGVLAWDQSLEDVEPVDFTGQKMLVGSGMDAIVTSAHEFVGDLWLVGVTPRALDVIETRRLTTLMMTTIQQRKAWSFPESGGEQRPVTLR